MPWLVEQAADWEAAAAAGAPAQPPIVPNTRWGLGGRQEWGAILNRVECVCMWVASCSTSRQRHVAQLEWAERGESRILTWAA